ncbi:ATP-dependent DNA helicase [Trichonephila clavipes]|nr:ATP-dependent DNA helicase [Trichonephila clavipes]
MFLANSRRHWCMVMFHVISHGTNPVKKWEPRKQGKPHPSITGIFKAKTLGRLYTVHPKQRECFYLRLLLVNVPGPTSFEFLRTVNGRVFNTYQDACRELQLLEDDNHWDLTLADAALTSTPNNIRQLFAIILTTCYPSQAQTLWEKYKNCMTEDILHRIRQTNQSQNIDYTPEMYNEALVLIEDLCVLISNLPLNHYGMPSPNRPATDLVNTDLQRENQYDHGSLATIIMNSEPLLTAEQKLFMIGLCWLLLLNKAGFFLDAPGGTGIAATLLDGGRTAHSTFKLPLDVHNKPDAMCNIKKNSGIAAVLRKSSIIIWDECTMAHKYSLEALNRTMQDLNSNNKLFGGAILLLSGDFRQTLPVIPRSTFADEINACLKQSFLWRSVETLGLTINMRVQLQNDPSAQIFSEQLLHIGNGKIELQLNTQCIKLPDNFCTVVQDKNELIQSIFPDIQNNYLNHEWLSQRAILAAKNVDVDEINFQIQQLLPGDLMSFKSIDTVVDENESVNFPIEFLNSLDIPGMPPHNLRLKIGSPIILLRNLNPPQLCNGTRLVIKKITGNILEATILAGKFKGKVVLLPRIPMIPSDSTIPLQKGYSFQFV